MKINSALKQHLLIAFIFLSIHLKAQVWQEKKDIPLDLTFPVVVFLNGNIHMIGGGATGGATDIHIRYNISTNLWDTLSPVPYKAQQPAGAVVNGKIHFCGGGFPNTGSRLAQHYVYDPQIDSWSAAADLPVATAIHKAFGLNNKLYILGGQPDKTMFQEYNPATNTWKSLAALPDQNFWYGGVCAGFGKAFRFGGGGSGAASQLAHQYDTANGQWISLPSLPAVSHACAAAIISDSQVFICGGYSGGIGSNAAYIYNIQNKTYRETNALPAFRYYHNLIYENACVYLLGGSNNGVADMGISLMANCSPANNLSFSHLEFIDLYVVKRLEHSYKIEIRRESQSIQETIAVYSSTGKKISDGLFTDNEFEFSIHESGFYTVLIKTSNGVYSHKILHFK